MTEGPRHYGSAQENRGRGFGRPSVRAIRSGVYFAGANLAQYVLTLFPYAAAASIVLLGLGVRNSSIGYAEPPLEIPTS
jgi:hypothetical protein